MSDNNGPYYKPADRIPLPPKDADVLTTACDYCIVACGYRIYRWPVGIEGGPEAGRNAFGKDFPVKLDKGGWVSPNMHNIVSHNGKKHHVIVMPDFTTEVVNKGGDNSIRGGCIAQKCYNPDSPTKDRLQYPMLRVNGKFERISWDDAAKIFASSSWHCIEKFGVHSWAQKMFSYQYFENTYALTKLALRHIKTPAFAFHDNPSVAPDTPGFRDVGIDGFSASYDDWYLADTLVISGTDPFETKTIVFNEFILKAITERQQRVIYINPRKTTGAQFAEENGGIHLWLVPGTDTILHNALARIILENGWEDGEWIAKHTANAWDTESGFGRGTRNTDWQWRTTWGKIGANGFEDYKKWVLGQDEFKLENAAKFCGLDPDDIEEAAGMMAAPMENGLRPKTSIGIEKGNYWSNNYLNTASIASLGLLCGAGNRPGQMISRFGGHQRGGRDGGNYPVEYSPEKFPGRRRKTLDLDRWVEQGKVRFAYVIGTTWTGAMAASKALGDTLRGQTRGNPHQVTRADAGHAIEVFKKRMDSGGMVLVNQDIYLRRIIGEELADMVFPAATWGEEDFTRCNGERRLRLYSKFYDAPGEAKPDWWIAARMGREMGFPEFEWKSSAEVFDESARFGRGSNTNYHPLVKFANSRGMTGHEYLKPLGTTGIQCPVRYEDGKLVGTKRLHDSTLKLPETGPEKDTVAINIITSFDSQSGKANFMKSPWDLFGDFYEEIKPNDDDELWVIVGRINEVWQSGFDDVQRRPYITQRWPENFLEVNPSDAKRLGIESGDYAVCRSDRILVQTDGFYGRDMNDLTFTELDRKGYIKRTSAEVKAVAMVMPVPRPGVAYMNFLDPDQFANSLIHRVPDPISNNYRFKLGVAHVKKIGESPYKKSFARMTFASRVLT